ncbi:MAG: CBS domain-containing protein [archaeon]|nr:CBS domain-containing protein [archaeon]MCP8312885.1 CBS domain-containing protein [archaeon]
MTVEPSVRTRVSVREVMNSPVITASPNDTIKDLALKMIQYKVGSIVITESDEPVGIVTDGDITLKAVAKDLKPSKVLARDIMSSPLHTIDGEKDIREAARVMRDQGIKRLGVTYKNKLVGMITMSDIISVTPEVMDVISEKARIMAFEPRKKGGYLAGYCDLCNQWSDYLLEVDARFLCEDCREGERPSEEPQ